MRTQYSIIVMMMFSIFLFNCKTENKKRAPIDSAAQELSMADNLELKLNNGEKWVANTETHEGLKSMDSIMQAFVNSNATDYLELGKQLSKQTSYIIEKCSMKGESHDQLHVVLVPMLDEISILKESNNAEASNVAVSRLEQLIQQYFKHFSF